MNDRVIGLLCTCLLSATVTAQDLAAEPKAPAEPTHAPVPRLVKAKLNVAGFQDKLILTVPFYRDDKPIGLRPTLFNADQFTFYDVDGHALTADEAAAFTPNVTSIFLIEEYDGEFAGIGGTGALSGGGKVDVISEVCYLLRCRILDRIRRFLRPIFRRPLPVLLVPKRMTPVD